MEADVAIQTTLLQTGVLLSQMKDEYGGASAANLSRAKEAATLSQLVLAGSAGSTAVALGQMVNASGTVLLQTADAAKQAASLGLPVDDTMEGSGLALVARDAIIRTSTATVSSGTSMAWVLMLVALVVAVATALFLNYVDGSQGSGGGGADLLHRGMTPQPQGVAVRQARFAPAEEGQAKAAGYLPPTSGAAPQLAVFGPPPICPSLILPNTEARFLIPMENLLRPNPGVLDILGTSGRKLLHAAVEDSPGGQKMLSLASVGCEGDPRARICTTPSEVMQIYGKRQRFYGTLEPRAGVGGALVKCDGYHVMTIDSAVS